MLFKDRKKDIKELLVAKYVKSGQWTKTPFALNLKRAFSFRPEKESLIDHKGFCYRKNYYKDVTPTFDNITFEESKEYEELLYYKDIEYTINGLKLVTEKRERIVFLYPDGDTYTGEWDTKKYTGGAKGTRAKEGTARRENVTAFTQEKLVFYLMQKTEITNLAIAENEAKKLVKVLNGTISEYEKYNMIDELITAISTEDTISYLDFVPPYKSRTEANAENKKIRELIADILEASKL